MKIVQHSVLFLSLAGVSAVSAQDMLDQYLSGGAKPASSAAKKSTSTKRASSANLNLSSAAIMALMNDKPAPKAAPRQAAQQTPSRAKKTVNAANANAVSYTQFKAPKHNIAGFDKALFDACLQGNMTLVREKVSAGANIHARDPERQTYLHAAATSDQAQVARYLVQQGANVNAVSNIGWTPLHSAARFYSYNTAQILIRAGAKANIKNRDGQTPEGMAAAIKSDKMVNILRPHRR